MMLGRVLPLPVATEVRALLPVWLGSLAVVGATAAVGAGTLRDLGILAYGTACAALGALSIGHEYTNRTLSLLLSQPTSRARILLVKLGVLAVMLLTLSVVAWGGLFSHASTTARLVGLSALCALFVAPWLTMLCRNPLAGAVFTMPIPAWIWVIDDAFVGEPLKLAVFGWGTVGVCAIAAVLGWRAFMRLEAIEGRGQDLRLPMARFDLAPGRRGHPLWRLAEKELGLQQVSIAAAGVATLGGLAIFGFGLLTSSRRQFEDPLGAATIIFSGMIALLVGSLASAGERQLGTLEWQVLLPMASWKQWLVKVGTAIGLAMLLAVGLPALLLSMSDGPFITRWYVCAIVVLTTGSLYVSSLSPSGLRALLVSLPVSIAGLFVMGWLASAQGWRLTQLPLTLFAIFVAVVLYFALLNHRSGERGAWRVCVQMFCLAGCLAFGAALLAALR